MGGNGGSGGQSGYGGYGGSNQSGGGNSGGDSEESVDCRDYAPRNGVAEDNSQQGQRQSSGSGQQRNTLPFLPGSVVATTSVSHFWQELKQAMGIIVCSAPGANFVVNQQTGVLVVHAYPKQLRELQQFLDSVHRESRRQVVLEAKILEVVLSDGYQAGIDWASVIRSGSNAAVTSFGGPITGLGGGLGNLGNAFTVGYRSGDFAAFLELLETQGEVHTLSSPRIATLNNQKSVIKVGSDEFFVTDVSSTVITGVSSVAVPNIGLTPFFSGIALDVTPQIDDEGEVTLHVHPSVTKVEDRVKQFTVSGQDQKLPLAFSTVRESDSVVHARNGEIVVIGGLMQNQETNTRQGAAWLDRLPVLGSLFRRGNGTFSKSELVILLKPMVVDNPEDWQKARNTITDHFRELEGQSRKEVLP
jgi:MSHA biogenesis protein MshL